ncbi:uncharacterized protein LOC119370528 [Jatropha curcas]|uniref:uncharacterized protein LOC119370528 n=1 Tax=Jatropha curcas TaxID=180498 RepID=UPI00189621EB|nr:uncharacterized protein LOC119370528 [Jatropha curcas]
MVNVEGDRVHSTSDQSGYRLAASNMSCTSRRQSPWLGYTELSLQNGCLTRRVPNRLINERLRQLAAGMLSLNRWEFTASYSVLNAKKVAQFVRTNILCRYGTPFEIITDNGSHFQSEFLELLKQRKIQHHKSSPYRPQMNGAVEAANKAIKVILQKTVQKHRAWHEQLSNALWGYRTSTSETLLGQPRLLVYANGAVLPIELEVQVGKN